VLELEPNYTGSWMNNGVVFLRLNKAKEGVLRCYSRATEINPKEARAWYIIGLIIDDQGKNNNSEEFFKNAIELGYES
jgi:tetratricopeptide (TPR) repeat protein